MKLILTGLVMAVLSLLIAPVAGATSVYDNAYKTTQSVSLANTASGSRGACATVDYSANLLSLFDQASNPYSHQLLEIATLKASYLTALGYGRWGVSQVESSAEGHKGISIYWTEDTSLALVWQNNMDYYWISPTGNSVG